MENAHALAVELVGRDIRQRGVTGFELTLAPFAQLRVRFRDGGLNCPAQAHRRNGLFKAHLFSHALRINIRVKRGVFDYRLAHARWRNHHARHVLRLFVWLNNQRRHDNLG